MASIDPPAFRLGALAWRRGSDAGIIDVAEYGRSLRDVENRAGREDRRRGDRIFGVAVRQLSPPDHGLRVRRAPPARTTGIRFLSAQARHRPSGPFPGHYRRRLLH